MRARLMTLWGRAFIDIDSRLIANEVIGMFGIDTRSIENISVFIAKGIKLLVSKCVARNLNVYANKLFYYAMLRFMYVSITY